MSFHACYVNYLQKHRRSEHELQPQEESPKKAARVSTEKFTCPDCKQDFSTQRHLTVSMIFHFFVCFPCSQRHQTVHKPPQRLGCPDCTKDFSNQTNLNVSAYQRSSMPTIFNLQKHRRSVHELQPQEESPKKAARVSTEKFTCPECKQDFSTQRHLTVSMMFAECICVHFSMYICSFVVCFPCSQGHQTLHKPPQRLACPDCTKHFSIQHNLNVSAFQRTFNAYYINFAETSEICT
jgi:ssDNA-binding Zn-finger/Zn-ribbon topoisomerase 1